MVNAKLDPEELPQNTLQVQTDIFIKSVNMDQIHFVNKDKQFPFFVWNATLFSSSFWLEYLLRESNFQLDISKNDLKLVQKDFFVKVVKIFQ